MSTQVQVRVLEDFEKPHVDPAEVADAFEKIINHLVELIPEQYQRIACEGLWREIPPGFQLWTNER